MVRFYQSVVINNTQEMYCTAPEYVTHRRDGKDNSTITLNDKGVLIENSTDLILVSWNNIASIAFDKSKLVDEPVSGETSSTSKKLSKSVLA